MSSNGRSVSTETFGGSASSERACSAVVTTTKARVGHRPGDGEQEVEVPVRVRSDRDDVDVRGLVARPERTGSTPNGTNSTGTSDPRSRKPPSQRLGFVLAVGEDRGCASRAHARRARSMRRDRSRASRSGRPDRDVDERHAHGPARARAGSAGCRRCRRSRGRRRRGSASRSDERTVAKSPP